MRRRYQNPIARAGVARARPGAQAEDPLQPHRAGHPARAGHGHLGAWGRRHLPASRELAVRAELLEAGGPELWDRFMDELRERHLGLPAGAESVLAYLQAPYEAEADVRPGPTARDGRTSGLSPCPVAANQGPASAEPAAGGIKPEIPDLTRNQPHPCRHDREGFVPGEDLSPARSDNLS